jgi:uncharacterized metal-binding protein YceD (DUF177 family)
MMQPVPEFSRPIEVARVSPLGSHEKIKADAKECTALAKRLLLPAVHGVSAVLLVKPWRGGGYKVTGEVIADVEQESVISLETFRSEVRFAVERYFLSHGGGEGVGEDADIDLIADGVIDLGEVVTETLGLELDPYPRKPGETFASSEEPADERPVAKVSPFAVLKGKDKP